MKKFLALALMVAAAPVAAQDGETIETPHGLYKEIGTSGDWTTIQFENNGKMTCAIFSRPQESRILENGEVISALRGERAAFITWEEGPVDEEAGVFSALVGAPLADNFGAHEFSTEHGSFTMFGFEDRLFTEAEQDDEAISAIRRGLNLSLKAELPGGRIAEDTYSLRGVMNATKAAVETCGAA